MDLPPPLMSFVMLLPSDGKLWHLSYVATAGHVYADAVTDTALGPLSIWARLFQDDMQVIDTIKI